MDTIFERLVEPYDNIHQASKALGISHQLLFHWNKQGFIPFARGKEIERLTNGRIKAIEVWEEAAKYAR